jgi:hypothetical protein
MGHGRHDAGRTRNLAITRQGENDGTDDQGLGGQDLTVVTRVLEQLGGTP